MSDKREPLLVGVKDTAALLGIGVAMLYRLRKSRALPKSVKLGRRTLYRREDLAMWVRLNCPVETIFLKEIKGIERRRNKKNMKQLADAYVNQLLTERTALSVKDIPDDMTDAKREHLKLKRTLRRAK